MAGKLFGNSDAPQTTSSDQRVVSVAVNTNVWSSYSYVWPDGLGSPVLGQRVRVPFGRGNRTTIGFITAVDAERGSHRLKKVAEVIDNESQLDQTLWKLGQWINRYYLTPLGMTLGAMIPSAVGKHPPRTESVVYLDSERSDWPKRLGSKQRKVLDELLEAKKQGIEPLTLEDLMHHSGCSRGTIKRLRSRELVRMGTRKVTLPEMNQDGQAAPFDLNEAQQAALENIAPKLNDEFSVTLLHGVTGSGKTEVYVRAIRKVIDEGKQAILLVPEIALATQTLQRLVERLPRVAVLHSGLTDHQRSFYYQQIRDGHASVVIGPRSAVFAPTRNLGLIVVDEEHESSYKQDTAPRYHGRDTAVMRASMDKVPVILGSATPSLESLHNAMEGRYALVRLPARVRGLTMPALEMVHLRKDLQQGRIELLGATLTQRMAVALDRGQQVILLMNRRGYASYVFCPKCHWTFNCENCTRAMVFHQATQLATCHYCQSTSALPEYCPACHGKLVLFGYGIQRIENELARKFPTAAVARMDSDSMTSTKQFDKVLQSFGRGEVDILLGTQMVAKGLDFPNVSLVGIVSADTSLTIPDFRASERTFQLIVQVAGRAGRAEIPGRVVVQTLFAEEPAIQYALTHDYDGFSQYELSLRKEAGLPPFSRMVRFICRHPKGETAEEAARRLNMTLRESIPTGRAVIIGPQPAAVQRVRNQFRHQLLLITDRPGFVQSRIFPQMESLTRQTAAEIIADVDPMHLM